MRVYSTARLLTLLAVVALCGASPSRAAERWVTHPAAQAADAKRQPVTLQFRRELQLRQPPRSLPVRVSADNRYLLFVNGHRVDAGPARGDLKHWRYRRLDIAPFLRRGQNVIAAQVWNDGAAKMVAQISARTAFLLDAEPPAYDALDTGPDWVVRLDGSRRVTTAYMPMARSVGPQAYYAASPPETHDAAKQLRDRLDAASSAKDWVAAADAVGPGATAPWTLVEDRLPQMDYARAPGGKLARVEGLRLVSFPDRPVTVPAHSEVSLLLDAGRVQAAYPELVVSGGTGTTIQLTYAEALYDEAKKRFRDRAQVEGGIALGLTDTFLPDGSSGATFQPFWWRVWRFVEIKVKTGASPLTLTRFSRFTTGYPFQQRGHFTSNDQQLNRIWQIGWETVRLDAHETFMDTAYWEQLQYVGDTRIEAIVSYMIGGDPRLAVQAIDSIDNSRTDGIPQSRWPANVPQSIPPFALLWVGMLHDYWMHEPDQAPIRRSLAGTRAILDWYRGYVGRDGLIGITPGWNFIDWRPSLSNPGQKNNAKGSNPCIITLMYLGALKQAADLEGAIGDPARQNTNRDNVQRAAKAVQDRCWSAERGLYADNPEKTAFSQHANVLAILYDVAPKATQPGIIDRITVRNQGIAAPEGVTPVTYYFAFYLARALDHAGLGDRYLELLQTWRALLAQNFTTWPEEPDPTRSDSHAWSAHPTADLLAIVAGITPASPAFATVRIEPHLGALRTVDAAAAHPSGLIQTRYSRAGGKVRAQIRLPRGVKGEFVWHGQRTPLHPGNNVIGVKDAPGPR